MTDEAFMKAIIADPDDDTHRLVYADWLEDEGGDVDRAALIRAQCAAERLPRGKARSALEKEAKALIKANPAWVEPIRKARLGTKPVFRRGFLHGVTLPAFRFVMEAKALFKAAPTLRSVIFPTPLNEIEELVKCRYLSRLTEADLSQFCQCGGCPIDTQILDVFACPHVGNLRYLRVSGNRINAAGARAIAASKRLRSLRELDLSENELGEEGAMALLEAGWLGRLTRLNLRENAIGARAAAALRARLGAAVLV